MINNPSGFDNPQKTEAPAGEWPRALDRLQEALGYRFRHRALLERAVSHRSWRVEQEGGVDNERLEFLGDAVLDLAVGVALYRRFPAMDEGGLTARRAALVNTRQLARVAHDLGLAACLRLGRGEACSGGRAKPSVLGSALEAVFGAVFLDGGFDAAAAVVEAHVDRWLAAADSRQDDSKNRLQELYQERYGLTPTYRLEETRGPDHARVFTVAVMGGDTVLGHGTGSSKKAAEKAAAAAALARLAADITGP